MTQEVADLIARLEAGEVSNELDVLVEVALFDPDGEPYVGCRANAAGTKVVYTRKDGKEQTCWPQEWCKGKSRTGALSLLRAKIEAGGK